MLNCYILLVKNHHYNGGICGTSCPLLVDIVFIQIHTHMTIYTNVKFHVNAVSLMGEPKRCSPPV